MKLDRLLAITMLMLGRKRIGAKELAERFEVSLRTVYRDMETLSLAGIPIVSYAGEGGGYEIMEGYRLERQFLTMEELQALVVALKGISSTLEDRDISRLLDKVGAMLSSADRERIGGASEEMVIDFNPWGGGAREKDKVATLRQAIRERRVVRFAYTDAGGQRTERSCEPYRLVLKGYVWYMHGFCRTRQDWRLFRLSRARELEAGAETFVRREDPGDEESLAWFGSGMEGGHRVKDIAVLFERQSRTRAEDYFGTLDSVIRMEERPGGALLVESRQPDEPWLVAWLLGFGTGARVLSPPELAEAVRAEAEAVARLYGVAGEREQAAADRQLSAEAGYARRG
ncbi:helix-turn-helix transcriptional regulator [Paenibacillus pasadenensis]|uniref:Transcriptional regulator, DeoR family n=1 Tax=Paenibacillus pasadenensis TaxID=217090 RepID=A0A2N5N127_9BACL|nr:YafY family protein [Paenibacillus pasadenensis]PLT44041.1 Transcriptional regulator, DeoR family [Paenibacillus pasadenensis]